MSRLEDELKEALRRTEPSDGFAERVLARAAAEHPRGWWERRGFLFREPMFRLSWVAVATVVLVTGVYSYRLRQERIRGEHAKQEVVLALRLAASELDRAMSLLEKDNAR